MTSPERAPDISTVPPATALVGGGPSARILVGNALEQLRTLPSESVQCCVTSPPYWGLRDYGVDGQLGLERTPDEYVTRMVAVFSEVRRVLRDDGTLWLNLGDSYAGSGRGVGDTKTTNKGNGASRHVHSVLEEHGAVGRSWVKPPPGMQEKNLVGIPWRVAFALQADGWYLRSDIIWSKPNPMPESVKDRPTKAHEYVFLLSKSATYYYDADAIAEPATFPDGPNSPQSIASPHGQGFTRRAKSGNTARKLGDGRGRPGSHLGGSVPWEGSTRNARSVWPIATRPFTEAHFATMPVELAQRCIRAGSKAGDCILDPFGGAGTTGLAAVGLARQAVLMELNPEYAAMAERRINDTPLFTANHH